MFGALHVLYAINRILSLHDIVDRLLGLTYSLIRIFKDRHGLRISLIYGLVLGMCGIYPVLRIY